MRHGFVALLFVVAGSTMVSATSFPNTPLVCFSTDANPNLGFIYDDGDGSTCGAWGRGVLCRAEGGPAGSDFTSLPPTDGDATDPFYMPEPVAGQAIVQQSCPALPGLKACCRNQVVFMSAPENPFLPTLTGGTHCYYIDRFGNRFF